MMILLITLLLGIAFLPLLGIYKKRVTGKKIKYAFGLNILSFFAVCLLAAIIPLSPDTMAAAATTASTVPAADWKPIGAALATGLSCIGAGIAVASAASASLGALSENPKIMGKALIFVALAEGIALYGVIISILILNS